MTYTFVARALSVVFMVLFLVLFALPALYTLTYGVVADEGVQFMTRRAAPMFAGPAVILWVAATAPRSALRDGVSLGIVVIFLGIALTGTMAFFQGIAAPTILIAAIFECLAAATLWAVRKN